jgi:adenylate cyclase class 2
MIMVGKTREIEIKFYVQDLNTIKTRLLELGAKQVQPRTHEYNLRFDIPAGQLTLDDKLIRLRRDTANRITYKGPGAEIDGVYHRSEVEFEVSDFNAAKAFLEALGYQVSLIYEKFRATFRFKDVMVALDELPLGNFVEIEGPDGDSILRASQELAFQWQARIAASYGSLFKTACQAMSRAPQNLTFSDFADLNVIPEHLGVEIADRKD